MKIIECVQGSPEWWEAKRGIPSASCFDKILTAGGKPSAQADGYIYDLIADIFCQNPNFLSERGLPRSKAMQDGVDCEPEARSFYELIRNVDVRQVGFVTTDDGSLGCSPDGLVGDDGGLELKCPLMKTHVGYLLEGVLPAEYRAQVHGSLIVSNRKWWDFLSYCDGLPPLLIRVTPDDFTAKLRKSLASFLETYEWAKKKMDDMVRKLRESAA